MNDTYVSRTIIVAQILPKYIIFPDGKFPYERGEEISIYKRETKNWTCTQDVHLDKCYVMNCFQRLNSHINIILIIVCLLRYITYKH
jgi:hypothetical protein